MRKLWTALALIAVAGWCGVARGAPFAQWFVTGTEDGGTVRIWGEGDEYDVNLFGISVRVLRSGLFLLFGFTGVLDIS